MDRATVLRLAQELNDKGKLGFDHTDAIAHAEAGNKHALRYLETCVKAIVAPEFGAEWEGPCFGNGQGDYGILVNGKPARRG